VSDESQVLEWKKGCIKLVEGTGANLPERLFTDGLEGEYAIPPQERTRFYFNYDEDGRGRTLLTSAVLWVEGHKSQEGVLVFRTRNSTYHLIETEGAA
jgi:hypothetical protein